MTQLVTRSFETEISADAKNLYGLAFVYDEVSIVNNHDGTPSYPEAVSRSALKKFLSEQGRYPIPVGEQHPWMKDSDVDPLEAVVGWATLTEGEIGAEFNVKLAPEHAERIVSRIADGTQAEVSLTYWTMKSVPKGNVTLRTEITPVEMSLVDRAAHRGAKVLAARTSPRLKEMQRIAHRL